MRTRLRHVGAVAAGVMIVLSAVAVVIGEPPKMFGATASAYPPPPPSPPSSPPARQNPFPSDSNFPPSADEDPPSDGELIRAFPVITPTPSNWTPTYPYPYDRTRNRVTEADITAMREMCQWYNAQYTQLTDQIDRVQFNRIGPDGKDFDFSRGNIQQQVDIVTGNLDKALAFLTPRVQALTQARNTSNDIYFPIYEGEAFFKLQEQLFNVYNGIRARQPAFFTGPSALKAQRHGSDINRSGICDEA